MDEKQGKRWFRRFLIAIFCVGAPCAALCAVVQSAAFSAFLSRRLPAWGQRVGLRLEVGALDIDLWHLALTVDRVRVEQPKTGWKAQVVRASVCLDLAKSLLGTPHLTLEADEPRFTGSTHLAAKSDFKLPNLVLDTVRVARAGFSLTDLDSGAVLSVPSLDLWWRNGAGWGRAAGGGVRWKGAEERLHEVSAAGSRRFGVLTVDRAGLVTDRLRVKAAGRLGLKHLVDAGLDMQLRLRDLPAPWVAALGLTDFLPIEETLSAGGRLTGRLEEPRFQGTATLSAGRFGPLAIAGGSLTLAATEKDLGFRNVNLRTDAGAARGVSGSLSWARGLALDARGEGVGYDLRRFMGLFVRDYFPVGLRASGRFEAKGPLYPKLALACKVEATGDDLDVTTVDEEGATTWFSLPHGRVTSRGTVYKDHIAFGATVVDGGTVVVRAPAGRVDYETGLEFQTEVDIANLDLVRQYLPEERGLIDVRGRARGRFGGPYEALVFRYTLDLDSSTVWGQPLGSVSAEADFDLLDLTVKNLLVRGPLGLVEAGGRARLRSGGALSLEAELSEGSLSAGADFVRTVVPSFPTDLRGTASASGRVGGTLDNPVFEGAVALSDVHVLGADVDEARGHGAFGLTHWSFDQLRVSAYGARLGCRGKADVDGFEVEGSAADLSLARLGPLFGRDMPVGAVFNGSFRGQGPYTDARGELGGVFEGASVIGYPLGGGTVKGTLAANTLTLDVKAFAGAADATVRLGLAGRRPLRVDAEARSVPWALVPSGLVPQFVQGVSVTGRGTVDGLLSEGKGVTAAHWEGTLDQARAFGVPFGDVATRADFDGTDLVLPLRWWDGEAAAELVLRPGRPEVPLKADVHALNLDLGRLSATLPFPTGRLTAEGSGLVDLELVKTVERWGLLRAVRGLEATGTATGVVGPDWLRLPPLVFHATNKGGHPEVSVSAEGLDGWADCENLDPVVWNARLQLTGAPLAAWVPAGHPLGEAGGSATGELHARGTETAVTEGTADARVEGFHWGPLAPSRWSATAKWTNGLGAFEVREPRGVAAAGTWTATEGLHASVRLEDVPLAGWTKAGVVPDDFKGSLTGSGEARVPRTGKPSGRLTVQRLAAELPPTRVENRGDVVVAYRNGSIELESVHLAGEGFDLGATGTFVPLKSWNVKAKGRGDLSILGRVVPRIRLASGALSADISAAGPWESPLIEGPVLLAPGARLALEGFDLPFEELSASGYLEANRGLHLDRADARLGSGRLHAEGLLGAEGLRPKTLRFLVELRDIACEWPKQVSYQFDGDGILAGTVKQPELRGEVRLKRFLYARRVNWKTMIFDYLKRRPQEVASADAPSGPLLDVAIRGTQDVKIENNLANLALAVDLRARGSLFRPTLLGRVEVQEGTVRLRSQEYDAARSVVEFLGETRPIPLLDLHGRTTVQQYAINVDVDGPLDNYQVNLSSVPTLPQNDLVALLSVGATAEKLGSGSDTVTAAEAASFLTGQVQDELESQVSDLLGFDQFHLDPAYSTSNQTTVPRVTVGKTITQALFARYSTTIGGEVEQDLEVQYTLTPSVQLLGTWSDKGSQAKGSLGGKVRFRYTFR